MNKEDLVLPEIPGGLPEGRALSMDAYLAFVMANRIRFAHLRDKNADCATKRVYVPFVLDDRPINRKGE